MNKTEQKLAKELRAEFKRRFETARQWGLVTKDQREVCWFFFHAGMQTVANQMEEIKNARA